MSLFNFMQKWRLQNLPLRSWTQPITMMTVRAKILNRVKMFCMVVVRRTLKMLKKPHSTVKCQEIIFG